VLIASAALSWPNDIKIGTSVPDESSKAPITQLWQPNNKKYQLPNKVRNETYLLNICIRAYFIIQALQHIAEKIIMGYKR